jgi:Aldo/keto reductase family
MTRDPERNGVLKTCEELGIGFVPWGPVGMGYLTGKIDAQTKFDRSDPGHTPTGPPGRSLGAINVQLTPADLREMDAAFSKLLLVDTLLAY